MDINISIEMVKGGFIVELRHGTLTEKRIIKNVRSVIRSLIAYIKREIPLLWQRYQ